MIYSYIYRKKSFRCCYPKQTFEHLSKVHSTMCPHLIENNYFWEFFLEKNPLIWNYNNKSTVAGSSYLSIAKSKKFITLVIILICWDFNGDIDEYCWWWWLWHRILSSKRLHFYFCEVITWFNVFLLVAV